MNRLPIIAITLCLFASNTVAQLPKTYQLNSGRGSSLSLSNSVSDIIVQHDSVWFGTERGLSMTTNNGTSWIHFSGTGTFNEQGNKGISAIAVKDNVIWVATGYTTKLGDEEVQTGGGLHFSTDHGVTWSFISQPVDQGTIDTLSYGSKNKIRALAITVPQQNITFDIALTKNTVWTASWAGMLRKSRLDSLNFVPVILPPDSDSLASIDTTMALNFAFDLSPSAGRLGLTENDNHKVFSVYASNDTIIWVGTAGGINKSTDGGMSWRKFSHHNQNHAISGNFVVALKEQILPTRRILWAATVNANDPDETKGVSYSENGGETWKTTLLGEWAHNFDFKDSLVYVATDNGLFRSSNFGESWIRSGSIYDPDPTKLHRFVSPECYGVGVKGDTVWCAGPEGIAYTIDSPSQTFGSIWKIFRTYEPIENEKRTYAYPNPFAPDDEPTRLHFSLGTNHIGSQEVSIRIFDYAMQPVRTIIQKASRLNGNEYDEIWDGKNDNRSMVANGVYFYLVEITDQAPIWGKILVLK
jgi:hypothetical protein